MLYPDVEVRAEAHQIFSALLIPSSDRPYDVSKNTRRRNSDTASAFTSITSLLERLQREKVGTEAQKHGINIQDDFKNREMSEEERKQGRAIKNSPNFHKISSIIDKAAGSTTLAEAVRIPYLFCMYRKNLECGFVFRSLNTKIFCDWDRNHQL